MNQGLLKIVIILVLLIIVPYAGLYAAVKADKVLPSKTMVQVGDEDTEDRVPAGQTEVVASDSEADPAEAMAGEEINWHVISGGGTNAVSTNFRLNGTIGQTVVGSSLVLDFSLHHGFWQDFYVGGDDCCGIYTGGYTGNVNCDSEGKRNIADIAKLIDRVYISKQPLCCEAEGDTNGDIEAKINLADIGRLIDHVYISKVETEPCS